MDIDEARRLYDSGLSFAQVGRRTGYSATWLARRFKAAGIPVRPSGRPLTTPAPAVDPDELIQRRDAGWTFPELARAYGIPVDGARARYLRAKGLPLTRAEAARRGVTFRPDGSEDPGSTGDLPRCRSAGQVPGAGPQKG